MATTLQERPDAYLDSLQMLEDLIDYHHLPKKEGEGAPKENRRLAESAFDHFDPSFSDKENGGGKGKERKKIDPLELNKHYAMIWGPLSQQRSTPYLPAPTSHPFPVYP